MNKKDLENLQSFINVWEKEQADEQLIMIVDSSDIKTFRKIKNKNTPKLVNKSKYDIAFCPDCKGSVWQSRDESKYCFRCGQRLGWGE